VQKIDEESIQHRSAAGTESRNWSKSAYRGTQICPAPRRAGTPRPRPVDSSPDSWRGGLRARRGAAAAGEVGAARRRPKLPLWLGPSGAAGDAPRRADTRATVSTMEEA
jgi:hypothetical protein